MDASEVLVCDLCGADDYDVLFPPGVAQIAGIVRCRQCGLMYANPRNALVDHEDYERWEPIGLLHGLATDPGHRYRWRLDKEALQIRDFAPTRRLLDSLYPQPGRVVEIGSGLGFLLRSFKDAGWEVLGVDPWRELPLFTESEHGITTIPTTLEQADLPASSADVMIMLHVIEHVPSPTSTLREVFRVLKPGGHLVLETPRYDTWAFRVMGKRERSLRQDGHIYFFTDETLRKTYEKVGFAPVALRHVGRSMTADRFMWNIGNIPKSPAFASAVGRMSRALQLRKLRFTLNLHDMVRIVIRKPVDAAAGLAAQ